MSDSKLRVWYGFAKLTKKIVKKRQLVIFFENENYGIDKNDKFINQKIDISYIRFQTAGEAEDAKYSNRTFLKYGSFIDEKPYYGDIELVLENNFKADENNVSIQEREEIRKALRKDYYGVYDVPKIRLGQTSLIFA